MKKALLSVLITSFLLTACNDEKKQNSENQTATPSTVAAKSSLSNPEKAEAIFNTLTTGMQAYYQKMLTSHPLIQSISYKTESYESGENESKAVTKGSVKLATKIEGKDTFDLTFNHVIKHDAAALADGYVAKIHSTIAKIDGSEEAQQFLDNLSWSTDVKKDETLTQTAQLKSFTVTESDKTSEIAEMLFTTTSNMKDIVGGFGEFNGKIGGIKTIEDGENVFTLNPFEFVGFYKASGDFKMDSTTPLTVNADGANIQFAKLAITGNMRMNEKYKMMLGEGIYDLTDIQISGSEVPVPIKLNSIKINAKNAISNKDIFSQSGSIDITPEAGLVSQLSGGVANISKANIQFEMDNLPASVLTQYQDMMASMVSDLEKNQSSIDVEVEQEGVEIEVEDSDDIGKKMEKNLATMFDAAKSQGANLGLKLNITAEEGPVTLDAKSNLIAESALTYADLKSLQSPGQLFSLLNLAADVSIPAVLLEKTGAQMMAAMFLQKDGDVYKSKITTKDGQLLINGMPAPL